MTAAADRWVREWGSGGDYVEHLDGTDWAHAPLPPWLHRCRVWTRGWIGPSYYERCACGATRIGGRGGWLERNQTRHLLRRRGSGR
jgi:hypothetical protein